MTLDPETIAAILVVLIPMIQKCLANRKTEAEIVLMLMKPTRRQRFMLFFALRREHRLQLREYWRENAELEKDVAVEIVQMANEEAARLLVSSNQQLETGN